MVTVLASSGMEHESRSTDKADSECPLRLIEERLQLMHKWRNVDTIRFRGQDCLFHSEKRRSECADAERVQFPARLQTFPRRDHFHA